MHSYSFRFYAALDRLVFCRTYVAKFFFIAFLGVHVPLIATVCYVLFYADTSHIWMMLGVLVAATLIGTCASFIAFWYLLSPIIYLGKALRNYLLSGVPPVLPTHFHDEIGTLLRDTRYVLHSLHHQRMQLSETANHDHLTGLMNRRAAEETLQNWVISSNDRPQVALALGLLDIDHFKQVNDRYGHGAGDAVLRDLGAILVETLRDHDWAARWGGEEFLLVIAAPPQGAGIALERLRRRIADNPFVYNDTQINLTVSIGYSLVQVGDRFEEVIDRADRALYRAKNEGRDRITYETAVAVCDTV